jgi:hypothetical protein
MSTSPTGSRFPLRRPRMLRDDYRKHPFGGMRCPHPEYMLLSLHKEVRMRPHL